MPLHDSMVQARWVPVSGALCGRADRPIGFGPLYAKYGRKGGVVFAPETLLGILLYGYATGTFSSRKLEQTTSEAPSVPMRYAASGKHPDHDTLAAFCRQILPEITGLFVQVLVLAALRVVGALHLGNISLAGSKIHADASKSKTVSHVRIGESATALQAEVEKLLARGTAAESGAADVPEGLEVAAEVARLANLAAAKTVLKARARERDAQAQAEY